MTYTCTVCSGTKTEVIKALGHNYVDGICSICGDKENPDASGLTAGNYVIAALVDGKYYAMSNAFGKKVKGAEIAVTDGKVAAADAEGYVITLGTVAEGYTIYGATGYLSHASSTNFGTVAEAYVWNIAVGEDGQCVVTASGDANRGIVYRTGEYNQFGAYAVSNIEKIPNEYYKVVFLPIG